MDERDETLISGMLFALVGTFCALLDWFNGEANLIPFKLFGSYSRTDITMMKMLNPNITVNTVDSAFYLFTILGIMFFIIALHDAKSPILLISLPPIVVMTVKLKIMDSLIDWYIFKTNEKYKLDLLKVVIAVFLLAAFYGYLISRVGWAMFR